MQTEWIVGVHTLSVCARYMLIFSFFSAGSLFFSRAKANGYTESSVWQSTWMELPNSKTKFSRLLWKTKAILAHSPLPALSLTLNLCTGRNFGRILVGSDSGVFKNYHFCLLLLLLSPFFCVYVLVLASWQVFFCCCCCWRYCCSTVSATIAVIAVVAHSAICFVFHSLASFYF